MSISYLITGGSAYWPSVVYGVVNIFPKRIYIYREFSSLRTAVNKYRALFKK